MKIKEDNEKSEKNGKSEKKLETCDIWSQVFNTASLPIPIHLLIFETYSVAQMVIGLRKPIHGPSEKNGESTFTADVWGRERE